MMTEQLPHHGKRCDEYPVAISTCNAHRIYSLISRHPSKETRSVSCGRTATASPPRHQDPINTVTAQALTPPSLQLSFLLDQIPPTAHSSGAKPAISHISCTVCSCRGPAPRHPQPMIPSILSSDVHLSLLEAPAHCSALQTSSAGVCAHRCPSASSLCMFFKEK